MFLILLVAVLAMAAIHVARTDPRTPRRTGEVVLLWLLVGYCGVPMLVLSVVGLVAPDRAVELFGVPGRNTQGFVALAALGMSLAAVLALRYRGTFLIGPAVAWAVAFGGGTVFHHHDPTTHVHGHAGLLALLATHALVALLLLGALVWSGLLKER